MMREAVRVSFVFTLMMVVWSVVTNAAFAGNGADKHAPGEVMVRYRENVSEAARSEKHRSHGSKRLRAFKGLRLERVKLQGESVEAALARLKNDPDVEFAEPNYLLKPQAVPNDPRFPSSGLLQIMAPQAWDLATGSPDVVVAVIDTGIDYNHEDLRANLWINQAELNGLPGVDDDGNGYVDDVYGISAANNNGDPMDHDGHGTNVAGTIGASGNNGIGVVGVNWNVKLMTCQAGGSAGMLESDVIECLSYVKDQKSKGVNIVATNNSYGALSTQPPLALKAAIDAQRDILYVASAGNDGVDVDGAVPFYPAAFDSPNLIAVGGTAASDELIFNWGRKTVDVTAPGETSCPIPGNGYGAMAGTSASAPYVAGLAALLKGQDPNRDWRAIKNLILAGGDDIASQSAKTVTGRRINAFGSVACSDRPLFRLADVPSSYLVGTPIDLSVLSINCGVPVGPVTVSVSDGTSLELRDDGVAPDAAAGDGVFTASWTPAVDSALLAFSSPAGTASVRTPALALKTDLLPNAFVQLPYRFGIRVAGGVPPYAFSMSAGTLPAGLTLDGATGEIAGTPGATGRYGITVNVTDAELASVTGSLQLVVGEGGMVQEWVQPLEMDQPTWSQAGRMTSVDAAGNIYAVGSSGGSGASFPLLKKYSSAGALLWSRPFAATGFGIFVAVDPSGAVYAAASPFDTVGVSTLARLDGNGDILWSQQYQAVAASATLDAQGNVYLASRVSRTDLTQLDVAKMDATGAVINSYAFTDQPASDDRIAVAADGSLYLAYQLRYNSSDLGLAKLAPTGAVEWIRNINPGNFDRPLDVKVDREGNVYFTSETCPYYCESGITLKYDPQGTELWRRTHDVKAYGGIGFDQENNLILTGEWLSADHAVRKMKTISYSAGGDFFWGLTDETGTYASGSSVLAHGADTLYLTGEKKVSGGVFQGNALMKYTLILQVAGVAPRGGDIGVPYVQRLAATGGVSPLAWSISSGALPPGLALDAAAGNISGVPTAVGNYGFTVEVADALGKKAARAMTIQIAELPAFLTQTLPAARTSVSYNENIQFAGGTAGHSMVLESGVLPTGFTFHPIVATAGGGFAYIFGTTTANGIYPLTFRLTDSYGVSVTKDFVLNVQAPITIDATPLPVATRGVDYSSTLSATGGTPPFQWGLASSYFPPGLALGSTGVIAGIPTQSGGFMFNVRASDGTGSSSERWESLYVCEPVPELRPATIPAAEVGIAYNQTITTFSGCANAISLSSGVLPAGVVFNGQRLTGTPTETGTFSFTLQFTDRRGVVAAKEYVVEVYPPVAISTTSLATAVAGTSYSQSLSASGGIAPYTWTATGLPLGLYLNSTGVFTGSPYGAGESTLTITARDAAGGVSTTTLLLTVLDRLLISNTSLAYATVGEPYSQTIVGTGGRPPYSYSATGLPTGLGIDAATGVISGTTTTVGDARVTLQLSDADGRSVTKLLYLRSYNPLVVTSLSLPFGTVGVPYSQTVTATGGFPSYVWSATGLPAGLVIGASNGVISGTPTAAGEATVTVQARDNNGTIAQKQLQLAVYLPVEIGTASTLADATVGSPYSQLLAATGGVAPYSWVALNPLPLGLSLDGASGIIGGTPTAAGTVGFSVRVTDANGSTATKNLSVTTYTLPAITSSALSAGTAGATYSQTATASGGKTPYAWSLVSGALPSGLSLNAATGAINGTPTTAETASFTLQLSDANGRTATKPLSVIIYEAPAVTPGVFADGYLGAAYNQAVAGIGGLAPYSWSIASGTLPAGLTLNAATGVVSGLPTAAGSATFTVRLTDANGATASNSFTATTYPLPSIGTAALSTGTVTAGYSQTLTGSDGKSPYAWSIASGSLPAGLSLNAATGVISGIPTAGGISSFSVELSDANGKIATQALSVTVHEPPAITTGSFAEGYVGVAYSQSAAAAGGLAPYSWSIASGTLPAGLTLNPTTGAIVGAPTAAGSVTFTVQVTEANGASASRTFTVTTYALPSIGTPLLPAGTSGVGYSQALAGSGGKSPYLWSIAAGSLPAGLALNGSTGVITGTPAAAGSSTFTVQLADANSAISTKVLSIAIYAPLNVATGTLSDGYAGSGYSQTVAATGGLAPYSFSIIGGTLPAGLSLNGSTGAIGGTPSGTGTATFTVQVADANNAVASRTLTVTTYLLPGVGSASLAGGTVGMPYSQTVSATGGKAPYLFSIVNGGTLPAGLGLDPASGLISGTPTAAGTASFTIQVADANGMTGVKPLSITVATGAVAKLNGWTNLYSGAPNNTSATDLPVGSPFAVGSGANRILLVAVVMEIGSGANPTIGATYGGVPLTQVKITANGQREIVWVGRMLESDIAAGANPLAVSYSGASGNVGALHVKWASFSGVNQSAPVVSYGGTNTSSTSASFGSTITYVANGMTTVVAGNGGSSATGTLNATPSFSADTATVDRQSSRSFTSAKHAASGSYSSTTAVSWSGSTSSRSAVVALSLRP